MRIVITGANGFIGSNLKVRLSELGYSEVVAVAREWPRGEVRAALMQADFVFHLAGVNRPPRNEDFVTGNVDLTREICADLAESARVVPVLYASSTQAELNNEYGRSKLAAEQVLREYASKTGAKVHICRLTNVFGKWCRPNYNSAVATFCHNIARGLPIVVHDASAPLQLVYIDDVLETFIGLLNGTREDRNVSPVYTTTVGALVDVLRQIAASRDSLTMPDVGCGLIGALYSTYVSYLPPQSFLYALAGHRDSRGVFVEVLKTRGCGQFSYFTAKPGVTRGGHYHHSKTEKFLVLRGTARFAFRHILTAELYAIVARGDEPRVVETVPGWAHDITNVGDEDLIVMLWANEVFDPSRPDTIATKVMPT